jgi:hypothetical protein
VLSAIILAHMIPENGRKLLICLVFGVVQQTLFKDNWRDQCGVLQSAVTYELCLEDYLTHHG